ncbi:MAG: phage tail protein [bacterium]|nr:phage tail protein [bacterium]
MMFGGSLAHRGWALCEGQLLAISSNQALFSILGTTYGGDGRTTFGLPDLRGRVPMQPGPGLSTRRLGEKSGVESVTLTTQQIPSHNHQAHCNTAKPGAVGNPAGNFPTITTDLNYNPNQNSTMNANMIGMTGGGGAHTNVQPFLGVNFIIAHKSDSHH